MAEERTNGCSFVSEPLRRGGPETSSHPLSIGKPLIRESGRPFRVNGTAFERLNVWFLHTVRLFDRREKEIGKC